MPKVRIDVYSHSIRVSQYDAYVREALKKHIGYHLSEWGNRYDYKSKSNVRFIKCSYVGSHANRRVFYFHSSQREDVERIIKSCGYSFEVIKRPMYTADIVNWKLNPTDKRVLRDYQENIVNYLTTPCPSHIPPSKLVTASMGMGKGLMAMQAMYRLKARTLLLIKPAYIEKWVDEINETFTMNKGEMLVIQGSNKLQKMLEMDREDIDKLKVIILAIPTYRNYIKYWEEQSGAGYEMYQIDPIHLCEHFKIGIKLIDESHQEFHLIYRSELYNHVPLSISMSATMESDQNFFNRLYQDTWPVMHRAPKAPIKKYILVRNVWYGIDPRVKTDRFKSPMGYSHVKLEQWLAQYNKRLIDYYEMVRDILQKSYIEKYESGQKAVVFCATKDMCTGMTNYLQSKFNNLKVRRYIQGDSYQTNLIESDITVTTLKSAGTAVDVPNLKICICTIAVSSQQANLQAIGRLRELKNWPNVNPEFFFLSCKQIDKHRQYAREKAQKIHERVLRYEDTTYSYTLQ